MTALRCYSGEVSLEEGSIRTNLQFQLNNSEALSYKESSINMKTEYHRWHSPQLGRDMELKVYGHWGVPFLIFPCSRGRFYDYETMGMIDAIESYIEAGKIKLYVVDSIDDESWYKQMNYFLGKLYPLHQ